jgi:hypothetical protein
MTFINPFGSSNTTTQASSTTGKFVNPFAGYTPPTQTPISPPPPPQNNYFTAQAGNLFSGAVDTVKQVAKQVVDFIPQIPSYIGSGINAVAKNPLGVVAGAVQGAALQSPVDINKGNLLGNKDTTKIDQAASAFKSGLSLSLSDHPSAMIKNQGDFIDNSKVFKTIEEAFSPQTPDGKTANAIGSFIGSIIPFSVSSEVAGLTVGEKLLTPAFSKFLPGAVKFIPTINGTIGFAGLGQITHDPENGSRLDQFRNDILTAILFETGGIVAKGLSSGTKGLISDLVKDVKGKSTIDFEDLQPKVQAVKEAIKSDTGKPPELIVAQQMAEGKPPKTTIPETLYHGTTADTQTLAKEGFKQSEYKDLGKATYFNDSQSVANNYRSGKENVSDLVQLAKSDLSIKHFESDQVLQQFIDQHPGKTVAETIKQEGFDGFSVPGKEGGVDYAITNKPKLDQLVNQKYGENAVKEVSVPRSQLPVGQGKEKASRLEARITESLSKTPQEIKDQLGSTYNQMNKKENIAKAIEYITKNPDDAMAILRGEKEAPPGVLKNSIYVAMENAAHDDVALARKLASLGSTRAGQELSILTEINPNSPVKQMAEVVRVREKAIEDKYGKSVSQVTNDTVKEIQSEVRKTAPSKLDVSKFIKEIQCK